MNAGGSFASRVSVATVLIAAFTGLAWADATGFMGVPVAWWLLPILVVFAVGGVNELVHLFNAHGLIMPSWTLRGGVVATFLGAAIGTQAFVMHTGTSSPVAALGWSLAALTAAAGCLFTLEIVGYRQPGRALERLAAEQGLAHERGRGDGEAHARHREAVAARIRRLEVPERGVGEIGRAHV